MVNNGNKLGIVNIYAPPTEATYQELLRDNLKLT